MAITSLHVAACVPLLFPVWWPRRRQEDWGAICLVFLFLGFCFPSNINDVVAAMACWDKVSSLFPYLNDAWFGADEWPVIVVSLDLLVHLISWQLARLSRRVTWPTFDCKSVLCRVILQPTLLWQFLNLISRGEWLLQSSKADMIIARFSGSLSIAKTCAQMVCIGKENDSSKRAFMS